MAGARTLAVADRIHRESAMSAGTRFVVRILNECVAVVPPECGRRNTSTD